jgi:histone-lysine N-methyltransferase SETMAR
MQNRHVTAEQLQAETGLCLATVHSIIRDDLKMKKLCSQWVPHDLTQQQQQALTDSCKQLLALNDGDPAEFFAYLVTGDESWFSCAISQKKQHSMQWQHYDSPPPKKAQPALTCGKQLASVFWYTQGILINWLPHGATVKSNTYCDTMTHLPRRIQQWRKGKWARKVFLLHDNARPHSSKQTRAQLDELGHTVLPHPPYSPDLAPSDEALFNKMNEPLRSKTFTYADILRGAVHQWCLTMPKHWFQEAIMKLPQRWHQCTELQGDYVNHS